MKTNYEKAKRGKTLPDSVLIRICSRMRISILVILLYVFGTSNIFAISPVEANGRLSVKGNYLVNEQGKPIQLRGMSLNALHSFTHENNFNSLSEMVNNWSIDIIRITNRPSIVEEKGENSAYDGDTAFWNKYIDHLIDISTQLGIYCLVDWHTLHPGDPNDPLTFQLAQDFFNYISKKYAGQKNILYEICNEPNGPTWSQIKSYANTIIPVIRNNDANAIIIVGTPNWSQLVDDAAKDPITDLYGHLASNVMYTLHFYASEQHHTKDLRNKIDSANSKGLAIFVTEFGSMGSDGNGNSNWPETRIWIDYMRSHKISWCNWQYSDDESSASSVLSRCSGTYYTWGSTNEQGDSIKKYLLDPSDEWDYTTSWKPAVDIAYPIGGEYFIQGQTVFLKANANETNGVVAAVDFFANNTKIGTAGSPDFTYQWKPTTGDYTITAFASDNFGQKSPTSTPVKCHVVTSGNLPSQRAYPSGTAAPIPGTIHMINFDYGGEMVAYHDVDAVHKGKIDNDRLDEGADAEGQVTNPWNSDLGYVLNGEWVEYTVNVSTAGVYNFWMVYSSDYTCTGSFHLESDGAPVTPIINIAPTGDWGNKDSVEYDIALKQGQQVLRVTFDIGGFNMMRMRFISASGTIHTITPSIAAGGGGIISPATAVTAKDGNNYDFTITPQPGYAISDVAIDGTWTGKKDSKWTLSTSGSNRTIQVRFASVTPFVLTALGPVGGTITPFGNTNVNPGGALTYTMKPDAGNQLIYLLIDGICNYGTNIYTFTNVDAPHTIEAKFGVIVNSWANTGGTVIPDGTQTPVLGTNMTFDYYPAAGYKFKNVVLDDIPQNNASNPYPLPNITKAHNIAGNFELLPGYYSIEVSSTAGGTITPGTIGVANHGSQEFTITPDPGYAITRMTINSGDIVPYSPYTFNDVTSDQSISVEFSKLYTISATMTGPGIIAPDGKQQYAEGTNPSYYFFPNNEACVYDVKIDNVSKGSISYYTFDNINEDHTVEVLFKNAWTMTIVQQDGGTINTIPPKDVPPTKLVVYEGTDVNLLVNAFPNYAITATFDGTDRREVLFYETQNGAPSVDRDHTFSAEFTPFSGLAEIDITVSDGGNVYGRNTTLDGAPGIKYAKIGTDAYLAFRPNSNFQVTEIILDGRSLGTPEEYTISQISAGVHTLIANFGPLTGNYVMKAEESKQGIIEPEGAIAIPKGSNQPYTIKPVPGYALQNVIVDGVSKGAVKTYEFKNVTTAHNIKATYNPAPSYTIIASANQGGTIIPSGTITEAKGTDQQFSISPSPYFIISNVVVDGVSVGAVSSYSFTNISANHSINVTFSRPPVNYNIITYAGTGGTITPSGRTVVVKGAAQAYAISVSSGYAINDVTVDGVSQGAITAYTFANVSSDHNICATYKYVGCSLLSLYSVPGANPLPSVNFTKYTYIYVLGNHAALSKMKDFTLQWNLPNKGLYDFSTNLNVSPWYIDLKSKMTYNFASAAPTVTISNSGIGMDGSYYVAKDGSNFVMVEKTGAYAFYFSTAATTPKQCTNKDAEIIDEVTKVETTEEDLSLIFPNPVSKSSSLTIRISNISEKGALMVITDISGKLMYQNILYNSNNNLNIDSRFSSGIYIVRIVNGNNQYNEKLLIK